MAKENRSMPAFALNLWYKCSRYQVRKMKIMDYLILIGKTFISIFLSRYSTYVHVMDNRELLGVAYFKALAFLNACKIIRYIYYKGHASFYAIIEMTF